ncbi:Splicing factor [Rhizophlyctis rosea]|nr:Splicing factor [Rhizophlyctis rosea]
MQEADIDDRDEDQLDPDAEEGDFMEVEGTGVPAPSEAELQGYAAQIDANSYDYEAHTKLIQGLRQAERFDQLRAARHRMASIFPLSEELWLEWIEDEKNLAMTPSEKEAILALFNLAVKDYLSIRIWDAYINYLSEEFLTTVEEEDPDPWISLEQVREIQAQALQATKWHFAESHVVWNTIKDFEVELVKVHSATFRLRRSIDIDELLYSAENLERVRTIYLDRLRLPHATLEETFNDYSHFESTYGDNYETRLRSANSIVAKTRKGVDARDKYEEKVKRNNFEFGAVAEYVQFERKDKKEAPQWVRTLYERAVAVHCLDPTYWNAYIIDMMLLLQVKVVLLPITERAVRNCYVSGDLWSHRLRAMTLFHEPADQIEAQYRQALTLVEMSADLEELVKLMRTRCEYTARQLEEEANDESFKRVRAVYNESMQYVNSKFAPGDPYLRLERSLIRLETHKSKDFARVTKLYQDGARRMPDQSDIYVEWAQFERDHTTVAKARSVYKQACNRSIDWPERVFDAWLTFERECGTVTELYQAISMIQLQQKSLEHRRAKEAAQAQAQAEVAPVETQVPMEVVEEPPPTFSNEKGKGKSAAKGAPGKQKGVDQKPQQGDTQNGHKEKKADLHQYHTINNSMAGNIVYVTNLASRVDETQLRNLFDECGKIIDVVLQPNADTGELEASVEFQNVHEVRAAAGKSGTELEGQPISVVRCRPAQSMWHFSKDEMEENKVYVSNLTANIQKSVLRDAFSQFGKIVEIRLVVRKTAAFAYIEFEDAESAKRSLKLNQTIIEPGSRRRSMVAISDPKKTKPKEVDEKEIYVTNLAQSLVKEDLEVAFSTYGKVKDIRLIVRTSFDSNKAFVEYEDEASAKAALALNGTNLDGRVVVVTRADPNLRGLSATRGRGGGRGGARGGGRGGYDNRPERGRGGFQRGGGHARPGLGFDRKEGKGKSEVKKESDVKKEPAGGAPSASILKPPPGFVPRSAKPATGGRTPHRKAVLAGGDSAFQNVGTNNDTPVQAASATSAGQKSQDDFRKLIYGGTGASTKEDANGRAYAKRKFDGDGEGGGEPKVAKTEPEGMDVE